MREQETDLWAFPCDVRCVTTNGTVRSTGENVMGGGCAREAAQRVPHLPCIYGLAIRRHGNHAMLFPHLALVMFPVKHTVQENADLDLVCRSACELVELAEIYGWKTVALPRPGCGLGGLSWDDVRPELDLILDDRFVIIDFPRPA